MTPGCTPRAPRIKVEIEDMFRYLEKSSTTAALQGLPSQPGTAPAAEQWARYAPAKRNRRNHIFHVS